MSFIVIEGLDGAGKSTQLKLLEDFLLNRGKPCESLHFPRTDSPFFGELVARFLRGELGKLEQVDPYVVALLYAGDRKDAAGIINQWLNDGKTILLDRYVYSNIAFQCAKLNRIEDQRKLRNWIYDLEFNYFGIPKPDLNIFLDVPFEFTKSKLTENRDGEDRDYLKGSVDIHEENLSFQEKVRMVYLDQAVFDPNYTVINCSDQDGGMEDKHLIFDKIVKSVVERSIV
jgi:dTMP kinase